MRTLPYIIFVFAALCGNIGNVQAQKRISLTAGGGLSYVSKKGINVGYTPAYGSNITASLMVSVTHSIFFETGIGYRRKGFKAFSELTDDDNAYYFHSHAVYDYISIPATLSYTLWKTHRGALWLGGGMNYCFLLKAHSDVRQEVYNRHGAFERGFEYTVTPRVGLVQSRRKEIGLYLFDTGVKLQAGYLYRNRWLLQVFHEHSLYSFVANAHDGSTLKLRYTGIAVGVVF